jgi:riboflavin kinase/FMN adenylyltransferase
MKVYYDLESLPQFKHPVVTIGTFDGVHIGHRVILDRVRKLADEIGGETVLITFDPHPRIALNPNSNLSLIYTLQERIEALSALGVDNLVVVKFTPEFASLSAESYIKDFLITYFHPAVIIIGYDHQYGKNRTGDFHLFERYKEEFNYQLVEIPAQELKESAVSSTRIRNAILEGDISTASLFLGRNYRFEGQVVHGDKRGRLLGFPTANIQVNEPHKIIPANGVYAVRIYWNGIEWQGMMNIGTRPTVDNSNQRKIEVHVFDFDQDIYEEMVQVECVAKIRDEQKFDSLDALQAQLEQDKLVALRHLN